MSIMMDQKESVSSEQSQYEELHVHQVYDNIASHFSSTRFKPWPVVDSFLRDLPAGSIGLDVGCGNGKYLTVRKDVFILASDRSSELLKFAVQHQPHDVALADTLNLPHPNGTFDFTISIAVVHHLSSRDRRRDAVRCIIKTLRNNKRSTPGVVGGRMRKKGEALIFVWALEQKNSRRGWDAGDEQDVLVPWVLKENKDRSKPGQKKTKHERASEDDTNNVNGDKEAKNEDEAEAKTEDKTFHRYYHLYRQGELEEDIEAVGGLVIQQGYDRDNWWAICAAGPNFET